MVSGQDVNAENRTNCWYGIEVEYGDACSNGSCTNPALSPFQSVPPGTTRTVTLPSGKVPCRITFYRRHLERQGLG